MVARGVQVRRDPLGRSAGTSGGGGVSAALRRRLIPLSQGTRSHPSGHRESIKPPWDAKTGSARAGRPRNFIRPRRPPKTSAWAIVAVTWDNGMGAIQPCGE